MKHFQLQQYSHPTLESYNNDTSDFLHFRGREGRQSGLVPPLRSTVLVHPLSHYFRVVSIFRKYRVRKYSCLKREFFFYFHTLMFTVNGLSRQLKLLDHLRKKLNLSELVAQFVGASTSGLCRAERHRFEPPSIHDLLSLPFTFYCTSSLPFQDFTITADNQFCLD